MTWFRVDDRFPENEKVQRLLEEPVEVFTAAIALWLFAGCRSAAGGTDGVVRRRSTGCLAPLPDPLAGLAVDALVRAGLWGKDRVGYRFHDWSDYNHTRAELAALRRKRAAKQRKWRQNRGKAEEHVDPSVDGLLDRSRDGLGDRTVDVSVDGLGDRTVDGLVTGSRPVPSRPLCEEEDGDGYVDARTARITAALHAHRTLQPIVDKESFAGVLLGRMDAKGTTIESALAAIADAAADVPAGSRPAEVQRKVRTYVDNAKPVRGSPTSNGESLDDLIRRENQEVEESIKKHGIR